MRRTVFSVCRTVFTRQRFPGILAPKPLILITSGSFATSHRFFSLDDDHVTADSQEEIFEEVEVELENEAEEEVVSEEEMTELLLQEHLSQIEELEECIERLTHKYAIVVADQENTRRIARDDVDKAKKFCIANFARDLLDVSDALRMALESISMFEEELAADEVLSKRLSSTWKGVQMTERILTNVFRQHGIAEVEHEVGAPFDPESQEAVVQLPTTDRDLVGTVADILKSGYLIHDRTLRACQVVVYVLDASGETDEGDKNAGKDEAENEDEEKKMML